jgi:hypothetical protein
VMQGMKLFALKGVSDRHGACSPISVRCKCEVAVSTNE